MVVSSELTKLPIVHPAPAMMVVSTLAVVDLVASMVPEATTVAVVMVIPFP